MPALSVLNHVELWASGLATTDPDAGPLWVTLADLILALGIFGFTWFAGRNLPGLLEIAVLQKLPLDAGARYAASSVTRYAIMVVGVAIGMRQFGVGWQSVQWLVAAMTVGLGFGLQEIFANFVSGMILLFERPARVGDTVTIGDITGTVTKIQIRATTILDWDNKELIVPNREFVTGNLVNWTLSNPTCDSFSMSASRTGATPDWPRNFCTRSRTKARTCSTTRNRSSSSTSLATAA